MSFGQIIFGAFGVFSVQLSAPILVQCVPCPCFPLLNHYFYKKLSLYEGQLISKRLFDFFNSPKKRTENFCPRRLGQKLTFSSSFLGELKTLKFPFEINWPLFGIWILIWAAKNEELSLRVSVVRGLKYTMEFNSSSPSNT